MVGGGSRRLLGIQAVVAEVGYLETVLAAPPRQELPHTRGALIGHCARQESRFRLGEIDEFLRYAFAVQHALDQGAITSGPAQSRNEYTLASLAREEMDVAEYGVARVEGKLRRGGMNLLGDLG